MTKFTSDMLTDNSDGSYTCVYCGVVYWNRDSARKHIIRLHIVPEEYMCKLCNTVIKHRLDFNNHIVRKHKLKGAKSNVEEYGVKFLRS